MTNEISIDVQGFKQVLSMVKGCVPSKPSMPILSNVKLDYDQKQSMFYLSASNGDQYITVECAERTVTDDGVRVEPCVRLLKESKEGWQPVCIDYAALRNIFSLLPVACRCLVRLEYGASQQVCIIDYHEGKISLPFFACDEFPVIPAVVTASSEAGQRRKQLVDDIERITKEQGENAEGLVMMRTELSGIPDPQCVLQTDGSALLSVVGEAKSCTANDELRPVMNAVCMECFIDSIVVVASDGHVLYKQTIETPGYIKERSFAADGSVRLLIPKQTMAAIGALSGKNITISADSQRIQFATDGVTLVTRCIEGNFPNYDAVIPKDNPYKVQMSRESLKMALRRISLTANASSQMAILRMDNNAFLISANDLELSREGSERVTIQQNDAFLPDGFAIGVKISNTLSLLDLLDEDSITLFFSDPSCAFLMKNETPKLQGKTLLQMPMLIDQKW